MSSGRRMVLSTSSGVSCILRRCEARYLLSGAWDFPMLTQMMQDEASRGEGQSWSE